MTILSIVMCIYRYKYSVCVCMYIYIYICYTCIYIYIYVYIIRSPFDAAQGCATARNMFKKGCPPPPDSVV